VRLLLTLVILLFPSAHLARISEYDHILLLGGGVRFRERENEKKKMKKKNNNAHVDFKNISL
jgi:hypothetical protein